VWAALLAYDYNVLVDISYCGGMKSVQIQASTKPVHDSTGVEGDLWRPQDKRPLSHTLTFCVADTSSR